MEINWNLIIIAFIISITINVIVNAIKEIKLAKMTKYLIENSDIEKVKIMSGDGNER